MSNSGLIEREISHFLLEPNHSYSLTHTTLAVLVVLLPAAYATRIQSGLVSSVRERWFRWAAKNAIMTPFSASLEIMA